MGVLVGAGVGVEVKRQASVSGSGNGSGSRGARDGVDDGVSVRVSECVCVMSECV